MLSYDENAQALSTAARRELLKSAGEDFTAARAAANRAAECEIEAINKLRECGIKLREAALHENPSLAFFKNVQAELPAAMTFSAMKFCVHLAHTIDEPITTLEEARTARRRLFEALGDEPASRRLEQQNVHDRNPWSEFISGASKFTSLFSELEEEPMADWSRDKLRKFVATCKPIAEKFHRAESLLQGR